MFCPNCRAEYVEGITRCPDCGVDLVEDLSVLKPEPEFQESDWKMIYRPSSAQEVALIQMIFEREKIPFFIGNENTRRAALFAPANLAFELWVPEKFALRAIAVLDEIG